MKNIVIIVFLIGSLVLVTLGFQKYYLNRDFLTPEIELLGGVYDNNFINLEYVLSSFGILEQPMEKTADMYVVYTIDYTLCANAIVEIKEYSKLIENFSRKKNIQFQQYLLFADKDKKRAEKEIKFFDLEFPIGIGSDSSSLKKLQKFDDENNQTKQILFIDENYKIRYRNRISAARIIPVNEKNRVIEFGADSFIKQKGDIK